MWGGRVDATHFGRCSPSCALTQSEISIFGRKCRAKSTWYRQGEKFEQKHTSQCSCRAFTVEIEHQGGVTALEVVEGDTILETALNAGLYLSHDCKMGVCMTCPAKLVSGKVDDQQGMLDEEAKQKGYTLLCVSEPKSDCRIKIIDEDEILEQVLCSSSNVG